MCLGVSQAQRKWPGGGADGSLFYFKDTEFVQSSNNFFEPYYGMLAPIADKYKGEH